jgi:hypothetical protein
VGNRGTSAGVRIDGAPALVRCPSAGTSGMHDQQ